MLGNDLATTTPIWFNSVAFAHVNDTRCLTTAEIVGVNGHGANPVVIRSGPHANGAANTDLLNARPVMPMPPIASSALVRTADDGWITLKVSGTLSYPLA